MTARGASISRPSHSPDTLAPARRVIDSEVAALRELSRLLDDRFAAAIALLEQVKGRVIVAGMGKGGHVARKIAATMASTGTPSQFVHPGEASHGDLGMVTADDAILLLSKSGETRELHDMVAHAKRFSIPLVAITAKLESALGRAADVVLELPDVAEACPMGLAPTTSTTMMLALGDALAVTLLERKGFSADNFRVLHPGGKLGSALLRVSDLMHAGDELPLCPPDAPMADVLLVMSAKNFGCAGVVDADNRLLGIITDGDLRRHMSDGLLKQPARAVMTPGPRTIRPGALAAEAVAQMAGKITNLFVVENERVAGIVRLHDCLQAGVV
jgi:arabinose-5-phosphate isomerase